MSTSQPHEGDSELEELEELETCVNSVSKPFVLHVTVILGAKTKDV